MEGEIRKKHLEGGKRKSSISTPLHKPKRVKLEKQELQKHNMGYQEFVDQLGELQLRYCPMCDREVSPGNKFKS